MPNSAVDGTVTKRRQPEQTIRMIMESARREFCDRGLAGAKIDAIAAGAMVTKQLVYHYFRSKEELYTAVLENVAEITTQEMLDLDLDSVPPDQALERFFGRIFDQYIEWPNLSTLLMDENIHRGEHMSLRHGLRVRGPEMIRRLDRILQRGIEAKLFRADIDVNVLFHLGHSLMAGSFTSGYSTAAFIAPEVLPLSGGLPWRDRAIEFILAALRP